MQALSESIAALAHEARQKVVLKSAVASVIEDLLASARCSFTEAVFIEALA
jgi:hypothetical protein